MYLFFYNDAYSCEEKMDHLLPPAYMCSVANYFTGCQRLLFQVVAGCFYYLYSNLPSMNTFTPNSQFYGLSPGGLANGRNGSDYYGHVFWDQVRENKRYVGENDNCICKRQ